MYSNSIVKIEACDGAVEDEPEVDPFMDISSLRSNVKVEVTEGVLGHSSVDLKPELPIPPVQNDEEFQPGEFLQVKIEESADEINSQVTFEPEPSLKDETEDTWGEEDNDPTGKYKGVFFKDVMEEFIEKYQPNPSLLILLESEPCLRFLPQLGSVRCEPCYLGIRKINEVKGLIPKGISNREGYKFPNFIYKSVFVIKQHLRTTRHLHFTANQPDPKECDFGETLFMNDSILELFKSKFSAGPSLLRILESDMKGNQCLVLLPKQESLRCEVCYRSKFHARSTKSDFTLGIDGKRGLCVSGHANNNTTARLAQYIVEHFISDEHSAVVNRRKYFRGPNTPKRPKLSPPDASKSGNSSSTPSPRPPPTPDALKSSVDGSSTMEINKATLKLIKSHLKLPSKAAMNVLIKDSSEYRCLVYLPTLKSIRCEICFRDDGVKGLSIKKRGDLVRVGGMKDFNNHIKAQIITKHLNSRRHVQGLLKGKRNGRDQKKSFPSESPSSINPVKVKIEPKFGSKPMNFKGASGKMNGADPIDPELRGIVIESVDIKEEKSLI